MFKNGFFYIAILFLVFGGFGCSSNSGSGEDLDISEIQEIEATGEFSEDEFFSDEGDIDIAEEKLVEEVPGLEAELEGDIAEVEQDLDGIGSDELDLDIAEDTSVSDDLAGDDLFDDIASDTDGLVEGKSENKNVTVTADDLGFEDDLDLEGEILAGDDALMANNDELDLDEEEDLFRTDDLPEESIASSDAFEQSADDLLGEDVSVDTDYSEQISANTSAEDVLGEDTSSDIDYSQEISDDKSASELLADDVSIDVDYSQPTASPTSTGLVSVKKMKTVPYSKNGVLVNAIYFVRAGDSLRAIADKIYGGGSGVDFRIVNPHLRKGALKVGQKVYYNSPTRSQDRSRLLTYYEDARVPAQTYSAQEGENLRTLSKTLLGHSRSWMEVWATNQQIESKWGLEQPFQIRYWNGGAAPAPTLARNAPAPKPVAKIEEPVATEVPESESQASLDLGEEEMFEEDMPEPEVAVVENMPEEDMLDEPDMELDEPAEIDMAMEDDALMDEDDPAAEMAMEDDPAFGGDDSTIDEETAAVAAVEGRDIARNNGAFPAKTSGALGGDTMRMGIIGVALLLLLAVGFLVVRKRRASQDAIEMESFDFGGETTVDEGQTKTQIDL